MFKAKEVSARRLILVILSGRANTSSVMAPNAAEFTCEAASQALGSSTDVVLRPIIGIR